MNIFHISEIVDMGIEKEKKRRDFYALAVQKFEDEKIKKLFGKLRDWEESHIAKFTLIRDSITENPSAESYKGELAEYAQALVDDKIYLKSDPDEFAKSVHTIEDAIGCGIQFEKDAILFFLGLLPYVDADNKAVIEQLLEEERQHVVYLYQLKQGK